MEKVKISFIDLVKRSYMVAIHFMRKPLYLVLSFFMLFGLVPSMAQTSSGAAWETVIHLNQKYINAAQIPSYYREYGFARSQVGSNKIRFTAKNKKTIIDFIVGSQEVFLNGLKFHFSYPVIVKGGKTLISQIDLVKLIDPILRPSNIGRSSVVKTVVIDAGHGGYEPGTVNRYGKEKEFTWKLAQKLREKLVRRGFKVAFTRNGDQYVSLNGRVEIANKYSDAIFVSLHFNAGGAGRAYGIETFTLSPAGVAHYGRGLKASDLKTRTGNAQDSANIALATAIHGRAIRNLKARDRGIRRARFNVITGVRHPGVLFEGGFMSHYKEGALIAKDAYLDQIAQSLFEGIVLYKTATEKRR